jgi:phytanoyl-CoA hydroxylase
MVLTAEQRDAYDLKGFCMVPDLIDAPLLAQLREEYDAELHSTGSGFQNIAAPANSATSDERDRQAPEPGGEVMLQRINMSEISMVFRRLLYNEQMLDAAEQLMGDEAPGLQLFHDQALHKPAVEPHVGSFGGNMQWHQDNAYWRCQPAELLSCWIALDDVSEDNGALRMVPGSFTTGLEGIPMPSGHREDGDAYRREHIDPVFDVSQAETLAPLSAGGAIFHHCRCLHSSLPNRTERQRRAFVVHFMAPGTVGSDGSVLESSWQRPILRLRGSGVAKL